MDTRQWNLALAQARAITSDLEKISDYIGILGTARSIALIGVLQNLAYLDPDSGGETDITSWCERQWATMLQTYPQNVQALQGKGMVEFSRLF